MKPVPGRAKWRYLAGFVALWIVFAVALAFYVPLTYGGEFLLVGAVGFWLLVLLAGLGVFWLWRRAANRAPSRDLESLT